MASLFEALLGADNPVTQWTQRNSNLLTGLGTSLLSDGMNFQPAQVGATLDRQAAAQKEADAKLAASTNATKQWLAQNYPDLAQAVDAGLPVSDAWQEAFNRKNQKTAQVDLSSTVEGRQQLATQYGLAGQEAQMYVLTGKLPGANDSSKFGFTPIPVVDAQGNYQLLQPGSDGSTNTIKLPDGYRFDPGAVNADKSAGTAFGTAQGGAQFSLPSAKASLEQELANIAALKADSKGKQETFGNIAGIPQQWLGALPATDKYGYKQRVEQVVGENFIQAFNSLKGAGAITEQEGAKAQAAMGRLSTAQKQEDFDQALADLEAVIKKGYEVLQQKAGMSFSSGGNAPAGNTTSTGVTWSVSP